MRALSWLLLLVFAYPAYCANQVKNHVLVECPQDDDVCTKDRIGFDAIRQLHVQIDDDHNGNLDRSESDEFIRDELKYEDGFDRHSNFHGNDDLISVDDLWKLWIQSEVYNWTVDDVVEWVSSHVELPKYAETFKVNAVDGHTLPRIAANAQYVTNILGIKNPVHRQKLSLKSMDLVLFGAPKRHNYMKDVALVASLLIACGGCWLAYVQHRYSQKHLRKVMKDLDTLHKAEEAFTQLKFKLEKAQEQQQEVEVEKKTLEAKMTAEIDQAKGEADRLRQTRETTEEEISRLRLAEEELIQVRSALRKAEKELEVHQMGMPLAELQNWLQLTYEIETRHYDVKRETAERQLLVAKEMCEKIRKKRNAFLGSLRIAHTTSIDDTDHMIMSARAALEEMKMDLQERSHRWQQIENICGFSVLHNPGLPYLEAVLKSSTGHPYAGGSCSLLSSRSSSLMAPLNVDDADEDQPPGGMTSAVAFYSAPAAHQPTYCSPTPGLIHPEPKIWPNLMRAGMQLTMLGLGLTHPQAMHSMGPGMAADKRTMLTSAVSGSSVRRAPLATIPSQDSSSEPKTDSEESLNQSMEKSANGKVQFDLGSPSDSLVVEDSNRERANSVGKSYRQPNMSTSDTGTSNGKGLPRPSTLPSALSDSAYSSIPHSASAGMSQTSANKGTYPYRRPPSTVSTPSVDDNSSPESTDSATGKGEVEKRKKKKKLLSKILGREKQKST